MVYFKIEEAHEDPSQVAMELAEAMQSISLMEADIRHYTTQIEQERSRVRELNALVFDIRKKRAEGYVPKGRMDPYATYDLKAIEQDLKDSKDRAKTYGEIIKTQQQVIQKHQNNIPKIRARLQVANKAKKAAQKKSGG